MIEKETIDIYTDAAYHLFGLIRPEIVFFVCLFFVVVCLFVCLFVCLIVCLFCYVLLCFCVVLACVCFSARNTITLRMRR
jgi:uncharacterized membrane protein